MSNLARFAALLVAAFVAAAPLAATANAEFDALVAAANNGDVDSQLALGNYYLSGDDVPRDEKEAFAWFKKAANQGNAEAQFKVGFAYKAGEAVRQDYELAYMWLDLAAQQGDEQAIMVRKNLSELMKDDEVFRAQKLARNWKPDTTR